ncbi:MAG: hypothetical protein EBS42_14595 [Caulobacteraceae bacterium]|nr:hypothetical protein [Caulobacteraceae bacterium]
MKGFMSLRPFACLALLMALAVPAEALAAAGPEKKAVAAQYVDISPVALPVIVRGRIINYIFLMVRINLSPTADATKLRTKEPYFRDALVRAAHRTPFTDPKSYVQLDEARLKAALLKEAGAIGGARNIVSITVTSQTPKQRSNLPRPPG